MASTTADPDSLVQDAVELYRRGQLRTAETYCQRALKARPGHAGAMDMLGILLHSQGRHAKAAQIFRELTQRYPRDTRHWVNLGTALQAQGMHQGALTAYLKARELGESSASFYYNVGLVYRDTGDLEQARAAFGAAARRAPDDAQICYQYALCCDQSMMQDEALAALAGWPAMHGLTTEMLAKIGLLLMKLDDLRGAARAVELALGDPQPEAEALLGIVQIQERVNQVAAAREGLERLKRYPQAAALGVDIMSIEARLADRDGRLQDACVLYQRILGATPEPHLRHSHLFPLAKALDRMKRYDEAFAALEEAHRSQLAHLKLAMPRAAAENSTPFRIAEFDCDPADVSGWDDSSAPDLAGSPVFIVGFPRSGTTLLEQTLDAHPQLVSMDETRFLYEAIDRMTGGPVVYPEKLAAMDAGHLDRVRRFYWDRVRQKVQVEPSQRLVDKNPLNLMALPAIRRLFPHSPILLAVRHPCDVVMSCYMQHFLAPDFVLLCQNLGTLAAGYRRAFDSWFRQAAILQPEVHEVRYETFVADFEASVRRIADFLALPWTDAMLEPAEHARRKGFISTPSYSQVVQPVNTRAVGRWSAYREHFSEAIPLLQPYLERWDYPV